MRETRADTANALWQAVLLHGLLFALVFFGLHVSRPMDAPAGGEAIEADLVDVGELSASMRRALAAAPAALPQPVAEPEPTPEPVPEPEPEPLPEPPPVEPQPPEPMPTPPEPVPEPQPKPEPRPEPKPEPAAQPRPDTAMEQARQQQLEQIRREREKAAREAKLAEQRLQQIADAKAAQASGAQAATQARSASPAAGNPDRPGLLQAQYVVAIQRAVERNWIRPDSVRSGQRCQVRIRQIPGGEVIEVQVSPACPYDEAGKRSLEAAILKASPLPYAGFESVFVRDPVLHFEAAD